MGSALKEGESLHLCVLDASATRAALEAAGLKVEGEAEAILAIPAWSKKTTQGRWA